MPTSTHNAFRHQLAEAYPVTAVLGVFDVVWHTDWDTDQAVAVIQTGGAPFLVTTDHGRLTRVPDTFLRGAKGQHTVPNAAEAKALLARP